VFNEIEYQALLLSVVYHDVIYEFKSAVGHNERASMEMAGRHLDTVRANRTLKDLVDHSILATITHTLYDTPVDYHRVAGALIDLDLLGLAKSVEEFAAAGERLWNEYSAHKKDAGRPEFDTVRKKWALRFLSDRPYPSVTIFHTEHFKHYEIPARRNLANLVRNGS